MGALSTEELGLIGSWVIFYALHSLLASTKVKRILQGKWGMTDKNYRLGYSILATLSFLVILFQILTLPNRSLIPSGGWVEKAGYFLATLGVITCMRALKGVAWTEFLGFKAEEKPAELRQDGFYARTRHPLYLGIWLIFLGYVGVSGSLGAIIHWVCLSIYLPFGIDWEEKKLVQVFGDTYRTYQQAVPIFFPNPLKKGPKP